MQGRTLATAVFQPLFLLAAALIAAAAVYAPGLSGDFVFDDTTSLLLNKAIQIHQFEFASFKNAMLSGDAGPLGRPLSMLSFAVDYYAAGGFDPAHFKLTNVLIHLLNGASLFVLLSLLLAGLARHSGQGCSIHRRHEWLALAVTVAWLFHPLATTSVLYVVQRMNSLATLFILWGLIFYLRGRQTLDEGFRAKGFLAMVSGIAGFGLLASLSKENGALLPLYALVIEASIFRFRSSSRAATFGIRVLFVVTVGLPLLAAVAYFASHPGWISNQYIIRGYSLTERLLTETRILWWYLKWIIAPSYTELGLFHDDITISTGLLQPITTLLSALGLVLLLGAAIFARNRAPLFTLGILWFFAGHSMESSFLALELAHEHRNYLPMAGILLAAFYALAAVTHAPRLRHLGSATIIVLILAFAGVTTARSAQWRDNLTLSLAEARHHPNSVRANYQAGRQYLALFETHRTDRALYDGAWYFLNRSVYLDNRSTLGFFGLIYLQHIDGRQSDSQTVAELTRRLTYTFIGAYENVSLAKLAAVGGDHTPSLPHDSIISLYDAAIGNPTLQPGVKAMLFSNLSGYFANQRHAYLEAIQLAMKAIEVAPEEPALYVSFANLLVALRQYDAALEQLQIARTKSPDDSLLMEIIAVESAITTDKTR